jgi:MOSC domain-containing protein YiiM
MGSIRAITVSPGKGTVKEPVAGARLRAGHGIEGDAHAGDWHRQVSLLPHESIEAVRAQLPDLADGAFAENIVTEGIDLARALVGDRLRMGDVLLEVTQIGKECHHGCVIREVTGDCIMPREGIFCRVVQSGSIAPGTTVEFESGAAN